MLCLPQGLFLMQGMGRVGELGSRSGGDQPLALVEKRSQELGPTAWGRISDPPGRGLLNLL